jgi:hypothetical protein
VVLDFTLANGTQTNLICRSDETVYVSGTVRIVGTLTIERGTVLKLTNSPAATIVASNLVMKTAEYGPAIITSKDFNGVGESIPGSTGSPNGYYGSVALDLSEAGPVSLSNIHFTYLSNALAGTGITLEDAQIVQCKNGFAAGSLRATLRNALVYRTETLIDANPKLLGGDSVRAEHLTAHYCTNLMRDTTGEIFLTNCLLVCVSNWYCLSTVTNSCAVLDSDEGVFETAGGAGHYLPGGSQYRGTGTSGIDASLAARLSRATTFAPLVYSFSAPVSTNMMLFPRAPGDTGTNKDLGYHYCPIDYAFPYTYVTNARVMITPGTVLTFYHGAAVPGGLVIGQGAQLWSQGRLQQQLVQILSGCRKCTKQFHKSGCWTCDLRRRHASTDLKHRERLAG